MSLTVKKLDILSVASNLLGPTADAVNVDSEYERAIVEMVIDLIGGGAEDGDKEAMAVLLHAIADNEVMTTLLYDDDDDDKGPALDADLIAPVYAESGGQVSMVIDAKEEPRYYWDMANHPNGFGWDVECDAYGLESTARIIDDEAGVIAYVHVGTAPGMVEALNANPLPLPLPVMVDTQTEANPA